MLSPVRKINKVYPIKNKRVVAMTFDDGPNAALPNPIHANTSGVTDCILSILREYNAKSTFNVIGTTEFNYPDVGNTLNSNNWSGTRYDHYPSYENDKLGGSKNNLRLLKKILNDGHELSNHGYRHILFGPAEAYKERYFFQNFKEAMNDFSSLHGFIKNKLNYVMKLSRPPHCIGEDKNKNFSIFDVYCMLDYNYANFSFDGGGWDCSCGNYEKDVENMVDLIELALDKNPEVLNGQIIYQKDGCNKSEQTPVIDALPRQLKILKDYGYEVTTVSNLINLSPYSDIGEDDSLFPVVVSLTKTGHCVADVNNFFLPDSCVDLFDLGIMLAPKNFIQNYYRHVFLKENNFINNIIYKFYKNLKISKHLKHPARTAGLLYLFYANFVKEDITTEQALQKINTNKFEQFLTHTKLNIKWQHNKKEIRKRDICDAMLQIIELSN